MRLYSTPEIGGVRLRYVATIMGRDIYTAQPGNGVVIVGGHLPADWYSRAIGTIRGAANSEDCADPFWLALLAALALNGDT